ncbi:MAG: hypothetical protein ILM98_15110 [Kiritimatiellae bacterium]|nr:hypothetical protein [Kiritimatiellia bacterium]
MVTIENGFAEVGAGAWLMGREQPAAFFGSALRRRRKGWVVRDRGSLDLVETTAKAKCADALRPFLTHIPCAEPIFAVSEKILVAPFSARKDAQTIRLIPMSMKSSLCVTEFGGDWVVMATASRTARVQVADGETFSVRPEAAVAWTTRQPTGFCPKLSIWDVLLPRGPRNLLLTFYGPGLVWIEGSVPPNFQTSKLPNFHRRCVYGV